MVKFSDEMFVFRRDHVAVHTTTQLGTLVASKNHMCHFTIAHSFYFGVQSKLSLQFYRSFLSCQVDVSKVPDLLAAEEVEELIQRYLDTTRDNMTEWMKNSLTSDKVRNTWNQCFFIGLKGANKDEAFEEI